MLARRPTATAFTTAVAVLAAPASALAAPAGGAGPSATPLLVELAAGALVVAAILSRCHLARLARATRARLAAARRPAEPAARRPAEPARVRGLKAVDRR